MYVSQCYVHWNHGGTTVWVFVCLCFPVCEQKGACFASSKSMSPWGNVEPETKSERDWEKRNPVSEPWANPSCSLPPLCNLSFSLINISIEWNLCKTVTERRNQTLDSQLTARHKLMRARIINLGPLGRSKHVFQNNTSSFFYQIKYNVQIHSEIERGEYESLSTQQWGDLSSLLKRVAALSIRLPTYSAPQLL